MARPKESQRKNIRKLTLKKAKDLFLKHGYEKVTIRRIAGEIGCSPAAIYLYYKNKDEILYELHNEGFRLLYDYKIKAGEIAGANSLQRLRQGGLLYISFAMENPEWFELMFHLPGPRNFLESRPNKEDFAMRSFEFLKEGIRDARDDGYLPDVDLDLATFGFWAYAHGIVTLINQKRMPYPQAPSMDLAEAAIDFFMTVGGCNGLSDRTVIKENS